MSAESAIAFRNETRLKRQPRRVGRRAGRSLTSVGAAVSPGAMDSNALDSDEEEFADEACPRSAAGEVQKEAKGWTLHLSSKSSSGYKGVQWIETTQIVHSFIPASCYSDSTRWSGLSLLNGLPQRAYLMRVDSERSS